eukprot:1348827-Amorphochlora_amoeboformis.AAC.1
MYAYIDAYPHLPNIGQKPSILYYNPSPDPNSPQSVHMPYSSHVVPGNGQTTLPVVSYPPPDHMAKLRIETEQGRWSIRVIGSLGD